MKKLVYLGLALSVLSVSLYAMAENPSLQKQGNKLGKKGIYGSSSLEPAAEVRKAPVSEAEKQVAEQERKRREEEKKKYPLSITGQTKVVQSAHQHLLQGKMAYNTAASYFGALYSEGFAVDETGSFDALSVGISAKERLQWLGMIQKEMNKAVSHFSQANGLVPQNKQVAGWLAIARTGRGVVDYHIKFNKYLAQAQSLKLTPEKLSMLASMWRSVPRKMEPTAIGTLPERAKPADTSKTEAKTTNFFNLLPGLSGLAEIKE